LAPTKAAPQTKQQGQQARHTKGQKGGPSDPSAPSKGGSMVVKASAKALSFNPIKQQHHAQQSQFNSEQWKPPKKERGSERVGGERLRLEKEKDSKELLKSIYLKEERLDLKTQLL